MPGLVRPCASDRGPVAGGSFMFDRGPQHSPRYHQGIDIGLSVGTSLYGCGPGRVISVVRGNGSGGYYVVVRYAFESLTVDVTTMHMSRIDVAVGQAVDYSTLLGFSGGAKGAVGAGNSTGPHLHLQVSVNGKISNPDSYLGSRTSLAGSGNPIPIVPITESDLEMLPTVLSGNVLTWPNGFTNAYDPQVHEAIRGRVLNPEGSPNSAAFEWVDATIVREAWTAAAYMANYNATAAAAATVAAIKAAGIESGTAGPLSASALKAISDAVIAALPKPPTSYTVTPTSAPAK